MVGLVLTARVLISLSYGVSIKMCKRVWYSNKNESMKSSKLSVSTGDSSLCEVAMSGTAQRAVNYTVGCKIETLKT